MNINHFKETAFALSAGALVAAAPAIPAGAVSGRVVDDQGKAVTGAVLVLECKPLGYRQTVKSNVQGRFAFADLAGNDYRLSVRAPGFNPASRDLTVRPGQAQEVAFALELASATVVVESTLRAPTQQGALCEDVVKTESISAKELGKTGATSLADALTHRPGIDIQVECSVCNVRSITLDNLPGRYTTLTLDGIPIFSPVSNAYGLDMLGVNGLESIDVSRGAGSSLTTPESLAGTVNLVSRTPNKDTAEADVSGGDFGYQREAVYGAKVFDWGAISLNGTHQAHDNVDGVGYGISQFTGYHRDMGGLGLFMNELSGFKIKFLYDHIEEKRMGGPLGDDYGAVEASTTGNPFNFSAGPNGSPSPGGWIDPSTGMLLPYNGGAFGLAEIIFTTRDQLAATADRDFSDTKLHFGLGYAHHHQSSWYGDDSDYWDHQQQVYLDANLQRIWSGTLVTAGINFKYEDLHSDSISEDPSSPYYGILRHDVDAYQYQTPGIYVQGYKVFFNDRLEVNASLREDRNNVFGSITTPRLNVLWHHSTSLASRIAMGTGYRLPTSFFEQDHGILSDNSVDRSQAKPERSINFSYALTYGDSRTAVTGSLNYTRIHDMAMFVDSYNNYNSTGNFELLPAQHPFTVGNADVVGTWKATSSDAMTLGLEGYLYNFNPQDAYFAGLFSRPEYRFSIGYDHDAGPWDFNVRGTLTGPQNLAKWYDYQDNPEFNLNGTPKMNQSPTFWVVDMHTSYKINKYGSVYFGVTNIFNYQQAKLDSYLFTDQTGDINVTHIWGPNIGRQFVIGGKLGF
jgi:outer membrane receptor for ferrienterochelin and colicins